MGLQKAIRFIDLFLLQNIFSSEGRCVAYQAWLNFTPPWLVLQFMEYSRNIPWNIPYSKIFDILIVLQFFRNIPRIFHIPPISIFFLFPFYLEYSIFQTLKKHLVEAKFWNIPYSIKCHK